MTILDQNEASAAKPRGLDDDEMLTVEDLATWLHLSTYTIYSRYAELGIPFVKVGGSVRFRRGSIRAWMAAQEGGPVA